MTQPLLGQRSRVELIAELYDRHAAGLFAYSHDQLGGADSASDVLVAVLSGISDAEPPRAALYALARREIFLRDIVYSPPATGLDPAAALVERVLGDLRTHQREVLYLSGVCEMDASELSWVLDVAADTADELTVSACRRFAQSLNLALASARVPEHMTEVFGALAVAPVRDVLNLAPWATPPSRLRSAVLGPRASVVPSARRSPSPLLRPLWPTTPAWPLPLTEIGPATGATAFPVPDHMAEDRFPDPFAPPDPDAVSTHEAHTQPMPKLGDSALTALDTAPLRPRRRLQRPRPRRAKPLSAPVPGDVLDDAPGRENSFHRLSQEARAARVHTDRLVAAAPRTAPGTDTDPGTTTPPAEVFRASSPEAPPAPAVPRTNAAPAANVPPLGDVLDDVPPHPLPGWPLQTDQLDALADRERDRPPLPTWAAQPSGVDWFADAVPSGTANGTANGTATTPDDGPTGAQGDILADAPADVPLSAPPAWALRPDHLRTSTGRAQLRLPSWVMRGEQSGEAPPRPVPPDHTPTPYDTTWDEAATMPGNGFGAVPPAPSAPSEIGGTGAAEAAPSLSGRTASRRRAGGRAAHSHKAKNAAAHHDWAWEAIGFVIAVTIAMIVFFAVPMITTP